MNVFSGNMPPYLTIDPATVNLPMARLLPAAMAFRYRALPIARDNACITVAMAFPEDQAARAAIAGALNDTIHPVLASPAAIDRWLNQVWPTQLLVYHQHSPISQQVDNYAQHLTHLLSGHLNCFHPPAGKKCPIRELIAASANGQDLVIFGEPAQGLFKRLLHGSIGCRAIERIPTSVLLARAPRWPLQKILLVARGQTGADEVAIEWLTRLAQASSAAVTVLSVAMALPPISPGLGADTPLGQQLLQIANRLDSRHIKNRLSIREGKPEKEIQKEVEQADYDLIIMADDPDDWWQRRLLGEQVKPLQRWLDRPLLIAKSPPQLAPAGAVD